MKAVGRKISREIKKVMGVSLSHSQGGSSSYHSTKPTPSPSLMDYEQDKQVEEQTKEPQAEDMDMNDDDALDLDLRDDRERQAYAIL